MAVWIIFLHMINQVLFIMFSKLQWNTTRILDSFTMQDFALETIASRLVDKFDEIVRDQILEDIVNGLFDDMNQIMSIFVKGFDGQCHVVTTERSDTIECRSTVISIFGISAHVHISLRFGGKFLESDKFLSDYGIQSNSSFYLSLPICGGCGGCSDDPGLGR